MLNSSPRLHSAVTAMAVGSSLSTIDTMHRIITADSALEMARSTSAVPSTVPCSQRQSTNSFTKMELSPSVHSDRKNAV